MSSKLFDVIDFEASSLGKDSFPIEVGWTNGMVIHSLLIKPLATWTDWDDYAESKIHRISREQLAAEGVSPAEALAALNSDFGSGILWCDGGGYDAWWLKQLEDAAGFSASFRLGDIFDMLRQHHGVDGSTFVAEKSVALMKANAKATGMGNQEHRAGYDAALIKAALYAATGNQM